MAQTDTDPDYPFLAADDGHLLRDLVHRAFTAHGMPARIAEGGDVHLVENWVFHLDNLARGFAQEQDPDARIQLVDAYVRSMLSTVAAEQPGDGLTEDELATRLMIRLLPQENLTETENNDIETRPFLEGVIQVLVIDHPDQVEFVSAELMERLGGWDSAYARAVENLRAHPIDAPVQRLGSVERGAVLDAIVDDSFYTASKALHAREFVEASAGRPIGEGGFYFAIPNRHQFAYCLLEDSTAASSLPPMADFTYWGWAENPGPISPLVYWHDGQRIHDIAMVDPSTHRQGTVQPLSQMQLNLPDALRETFQRLGA